MRMQSSSADGTAGVGAWNGARFFVAANGFTLGVGNILGAVDNMFTLYQDANSPTVGIGVDGANYDYLVGTMNGLSLWDGYSSGGAGVNGVEFIYDAANWQVHVSYSDRATIEADGAERLAISGFYRFGDWTVAAAYNDERPVGGGDGRDLTIVGVTGDLGFMNVTLNYAQGENYIAAGVDSSKFTLSAGFDIGAATNMMVYVTDEDSPGQPTDGTGYGFNVSHDLGGGVSLVAGLEETTGVVSNTTVQAGAYFRF